MEVSVRFQVGLHLKLFIMNRLVKLRDKWFPKPKPLSVLDAYTITKYGLKLDRDTLYSKCIEEIDGLIKAKSTRNEYSLVFDLDENLPELGTYLEKYYTDLGFNCFILDSKIDERIECPQLYLSWRKKANR